MFRAKYSETHLVTLLGADIDVRWPQLKKVSRTQGDLMGM
jgi:hypothetical protein